IPAVEVDEAVAAKIGRQRRLQAECREFRIAGHAIVAQQRLPRIALAGVVHAIEPRDARLQDPLVVDAAVRHRPGDLDAGLALRGGQVAEGLGDGALRRRGSAAAPAGTEREHDERGGGEGGGPAAAAGHEPTSARASASAFCTAAGAVPPVTARARSEASTVSASRTSASMRGENPRSASSGSASSPTPRSSAWRTALPTTSCAWR